MSSETFVFFGIVGSGKGTQVKLLMDFLKKKDGKECVYIGTGEIFREIAKSPTTATQTTVKELLAAGKLVPDDMTNNLVSDTMDAKLKPETHGIFDGYPRTVVQSKFFEEKIKAFKRDSVKIIYIEVGKEEAMKRNLLRARHDDTKEGLAKRFDEYVNNVIPAMNYFNDKSGYKIYKINGEQAVENVHEDIIRALGY